jgi:hypothetical protein
MESTNAQTASDVVHPQGRPERTRNFARDQTIFGENGNHEWEYFDEIAGISHQALALAKSLVDETDLTLLEISQTTVNEFRTFRRGARCEIVALDQCSGETSRSSIDCDPETGYSSPDDENIEYVSGQASSHLDPVEGPVQWTSWNSASGSHWSNSRGKTVV